MDNRDCSTGFCRAFSGVLGFGASVGGGILADEESASAKITSPHARDGLIVFIEIKLFPLLRQRAHLERSNEESGENTYAHKAELGFELQPSAVTSSALMVAVLVIDCFHLLDAVEPADDVSRAEGLTRLHRPLADFVDEADVALSADDTTPLKYRRD